MGLALDELIESYGEEIGDPAVNEDSALIALRNAFWDAWLAGYFRSYTIIEDEVVPRVDGDADLDEAFGRLIVLYAGYNKARTNFSNLRTRVKTAVGRGAVDTEVERSANLAIEVLKDWRLKLANLADEMVAGKSGPVITRFVNAVLARDAMLVSGADPWLR